MDEPALRESNGLNRAAEPNKFPFGFDRAEVEETRFEATGPCQRVDHLLGQAVQRVGRLDLLEPTLVFRRESFPLVVDPMRRIQAEVIGLEVRYGFADFYQ